MNPVILLSIGGGFALAWVGLVVYYLISNNKKKLQPGSLLFLTGLAVLVILSVLVYEVRDVIYPPLPPR